VTKVAVPIRNAYPRRMPPESGRANAASSNRGVSAAPLGTQRGSVDYSLQRRALLREVLSNRVGVYEVCDASPYLMSAARFHGDPTDERCPICRRENLTHVNYIYGDELKTSAGQARSRAELPMLESTWREFQVYVVEVCRGCGWNHLVEQFVLGGGSGQHSASS
jgi:hypothetical protein